MANVVTTASTVSCGHAVPPKQGTVTLTSSAKLKIGDDAVVLGIAAADVADCGTVNDAPHGNVPCLKATATTGSATKLRVGDQPVLLDTLSGTTTGTVGSVTPQTLLAWKSGPTKLQAS